MITTERLNIRIASDDEMRKLVSDEPDEEMKIAYGEMLAGCLAYPGYREWYAVWFIELKSGERVGDLCFKGLTQEGTAEIGYGIMPEYQGRGYATEAVMAMAAWSLKQPGCSRLEAETDPDNAASQKVLKKAGFEPNGITGEEGPRFAWTGEGMV